MKSSILSCYGSFDTISVFGVESVSPQFLVPTDKGYAPKRGYFHDAISSIDDLKGEGMPEWDMIEFEPLLDDLLTIPVAENANWSVEDPSPNAFHRRYGRGNRY